MKIHVFVKFCINKMKFHLKYFCIVHNGTVDSRYLEIEGTIINTLRYPYFDISDL